jgi:hypothetical protein
MPGYGMHLSLIDDAPEAVREVLAGGRASRHDPVDLGRCQPFRVGRWWRRSVTAARLVGGRSHPNVTPTT